MKFGKWKDIAEIIALLAVVGSLIAVVLELRQTQSAMLAQTYQSRSFDAINWQLELARSPELDPGLRESGQLDALAPEQRRQMFRVYTARRIDLDNEHYQYQHGFLDPDFYHGSTVAEIRAYAPIWRALGVSEPRGAFHAEVERILGEPASD